MAAWVFLRGITQKRISMMPTFSRSLSRASSIDRHDDDPGTRVDLVDGLPLCLRPPFQGQGDRVADAPALRLAAAALDLEVEQLLAAVPARLVEIDGGGPALERLGLFALLPGAEGDL